MEPKDPNLYVISLDAIDLNLLPSIYTQDDKVEPLWDSHLNRRTNECYQFQIRSGDAGHVKESSKPELQNVVCHICDIEVPKPFLIEHSLSSRHKTNLKISEIAINRMQKHLNSTRNENSSDIVKIDTSVYFCVNCVTVMDIKEKETHEKSLSHKNSVVFEKILHDFLILYDSNENGKNEIEKTNGNGEKDCTDNVSKGNDSYTNVCNEKDNTTKEKTGNNSKINENNGNDFNSIENNANDSYSTGKREIFFYSSGCSFYNNKNNGNDSYTNKRNENDGYTDKKNENIVNTNENVGTSKTKTNVDNSAPNLLLKKLFNTAKKDILPKELTAKRVSANEYLSLLNRRKDNLINFKLSADCDTIEIETIDGSIVKVSEENFHGFNKVGKKHIQCFVCKEIFKGSAVEAHKMSEKHIKLMVAPLTDKHCARQIDDRLSHCLICNAVIKESVYHALCDDDHNEHLKAALVSDKLTEDSDQYAAKCLTSNELDEENSNKDSTDNCKEKVENYENVKEYDDWIEVSKNNAKAEVKANTTETNIIPTKYFCVSCNRLVYYSLKHNETANHIWNLKSNYHYLMKLKEDEVYCQVCKVPVTDDPDEFQAIKNHVHGEEHVEKYNKLLVDNKIERFKRHFYCKPCNRVILIKNELKHTSEKRHNRFSAVKCNFEVTQHEIDRITEQADECKTESDCQAEKLLREDYVCNICNVKVPSYERNIQEHINGKSHTANMLKNPQVTCDENEIKDIHYQMELTKFPNVLNCLMCKVFILHNELSVSEHLNHTLHKMNYNIFLKDKNMVLRDNNCYCNTCEVFVGIKSEISHAFGRKHIKKQKLELATLIELKNAKDKDIRNLKSFASNNLQKQNINTSHESINEDKQNEVDEQNIATPTVSSDDDEPNIATPYVSINEDKQKIVTSSVSTVEDKKNIATSSVSSEEDGQNIATPSVSTNENEPNTAVSTNQYKQSTNEASQNISTRSMSVKKDDQVNIATPCVSTTEDKQNIVTTFMCNLYADNFPPFIFDENFPMLKDLYRHGTGPNVVSMIKDYNKLKTNKNINKESETNIKMRSDCTIEDKENIVTTFMSNLYADTFPPFIFDEKFPMLKDLYNHGVGPNVVSMIKDHKIIRNDPDTLKVVPNCDPNVIQNINKEDETNITKRSESTTDDKQSIVTTFMCNLYADNFPPFIFDENFPMLKDLYRHGTGPNVVSMIKDYNKLKTDKNINKEGEINIKMRSECTIEDKENIVTTFMSNLCADTFPPFIFDEKFPMLKYLYIHGVGPNVVSMIKDHKKIRNDPDTLKVVPNCDPNVIQNINKEDETNITKRSESTTDDKQSIVTTLMCNLYADNFPPFIFDENFPMLKDLYRHGTGPNVVSMIKDYKKLKTNKNINKESETNITMRSKCTIEDKENIVTTFMSNLYADTFPPFIFDENFPMLKYLYEHGFGPNVGSLIKDHKRIRNYPDTLKVIHDFDPNVAQKINKEDETNTATPSVSTNEDKQDIVTPCPNAEKQNIAMSFVSIREYNANIAMTFMSTNEEKQNIVTPSVSTNVEEQNIVTPSVSTNVEEQNIATPFVSVKEDETNIAKTSLPITNEDKGPFIDSCVSKVINDKYDRDPHVAKSINILSASTANASSLTPQSDALVLGKNPGLPETMLELLEPTANSKVVICKICKVNVPYSKSNVSTHINGSKHKNEYQKSLKSVKHTSASSVVRNNRPSIGSNASKIMNDSNVTKNINIPSVPNVKTVNTSSLTPQSDALVLGKNPGLPETMLELLEPTANSKEVICKICKVNVPYSISNVSTHINGSKHKNEYKKSLKSVIKNTSTSSVVKDNRPSIGSNASKIMNDSNVTKNINIPSSSNVNKVNDSSQQSKSDVLVLGENICLPGTMLELLLLEPTANSKEVICKICKVKVPYNMMNVSSHINGSNHKNALKKFLKAT